MHALSILLPLLPLSLLVSANPEGPVRIQAIRGGKPSPHMAEMLAEAAAYQQGKLVYPDTEAKGVDQEDEEEEEMGHHHGKHDHKGKVKSPDPRNWDDYPECSKVCTPPALEASGCEFPDDVWCMCRCPIFGDLAYNCEVEKCNKEDIGLIHELGNKLCEPVGGFQPKVDSSCKKAPQSKEGLKE